MSTMGIEALGGALGAMPSTPAMDYLTDAQNLAAGDAGGGAAGLSFDSLLNAASGAGGATATDATQAIDGGTQAIAASQAQSLGASTPTLGGAGSAGGAEFGSLLADGVDRLQNLQNTSSNLSVQAATGDLNAIHDYTIAAAEASTATQLTVALRNTALQSFQSIMNMTV